LGLEINSGIEEELPHYQFLFLVFIFSFYLLDENWINLDPLSLVLNTYLGLAITKRRRTEKHTILYSMLLRFSSFSLSGKTGSVFIFFSMQLCSVFVSIQFRFLF